MYISIKFDRLMKQLVEDAFERYERNKEIPLMFSIVPI